MDQSTLGIKAILFASMGTLICRKDILHEQIINDRGGVSHNLSEIYQNTVQAVKDVVDASGVDKEEIACLGISNQRETSAAWDKTTGEPLAHAIVWQCGRAAEICERIRKNVVIDKIRETEKNGGVAEITRKKTGMNLSPYFPAAKYAWLLENEPEVRAAKEEKRLCFGTIDSWLVYRLTKGNVYATDYSNASRTQLFNIHTLQWDTEICTWFGIDKDSLSKVCDSSMEYGMTDFEGYLNTPIPICGVVGDSQGALFAQGCIEAGMVKATYGTGSSVMMNAGELVKLSENGLVTSLAWKIDVKATYVLEGNINYTGAVITWLKNDLGLIMSPKETEELAKAANKSDTTYLVPAFSGLGAPYWRSDARACIYGMSRTTGRKEIVKSALESIAYQITDILTMMDEDTPVKELCVDDGSTGNTYLIQFQSDMAQTAVKLPKCEESSAYGAALLAGPYYGIYSRELVMETGERKKYEPQMAKNLRDEKYAGWKEAVTKVISE